MSGRDDMRTLILRLSAPWQSWGGEDGRMGVRRTDGAPTKSGVIGMIAAALGIGREADAVGADGVTLSDLRALGFGVRVDQPGRVREMDYHTAKRHMMRDHGRAPDPKGKLEAAFITQRWYLADAVFTVALTGPADIIGHVEHAVRNPVWPLYLGRRSCPASGVLEDDLVIGVTDKGTEEALGTVPWQAKAWWRAANHTPDTLEVIIDDHDRGGESVKDDPVSYDSSYRRYAKRFITRISVPTPPADVNGNGTADAGRDGAPTRDVFMGFVESHDKEGEA